MWPLILAGVGGLAGGMLLHSAMQKPTEPTTITKKETKTYTYSPTITETTTSTYTYSPTIAPQYSYQLIISSPHATATATKKETIQPTQPMHLYIPTQVQPNITPSLSDIQAAKTEASADNQLMNNLMMFAIGGAIVWLLTK